MNRLSYRHLEILETAPHQYISLFVAADELPRLSSEATERGKLFHQLMQQHYLGLPVSDWLESDSELSRYWHNYQASPPPLLASGRPEWPLAAAMPPFQLYGIIDLLVETATTVQIVDWKTYRRVPKSLTLANHWQTLLYLYLAQVNYPEHLIEMIYWFTEAPRQPVQIRYTALQHQALHSRIQRLLHKLDMWQTEGSYPQLAPAAPKHSLDLEAIAPLTPP